METKQWPGTLGRRPEEVMSGKGGERAFPAEDIIHAKAQRGPGIFGGLQILEHRWNKVGETRPRSCARTRSLDFLL